MYPKEMRGRGSLLNPELPQWRAQFEAKTTVSAVESQSPGLFGNVNILAFVYSARKIQGAENKCADQENNYSDQPHRVIGTASVHPKRKPR